MQYVLMPVKVEDFNIRKCHGTFGEDNTPFLRQPDESFQLKPEGDIKIVTFIGGRKFFIPLSTLSMEGINVEPDTDGFISVKFKLPEE